MRDWYEMRDLHEVGSLVRSTGGEWMVRPPQRCGNGHQLTPGHVLVGSIACTCGEGRHLTWLCDCGSTRYGPPLGVSCSVLNGPAAVR
jgi:hypothetical protein